MPPQGNLELTRRYIDAYNRRDAAALVELSDPELEWRPAATRAFEQTVYRGHEGIRQYITELDDTWEELVIEISEIRDLGDRIVLLGRVRGRGRSSGVEVDEPFGSYTEVREGKATRIDGYLAIEPALAAAGLAE